MSQTIRDIARLAGVSVATVSRVINGYESVSEETRARVAAVITQSKFRPNMHAIELVRGRTDLSRIGETWKDHVPDGERENLLDTKRPRRHKQSKELRSLREENTRLHELLMSLGKEIDKWRRVKGREH